jgi:hypothetical protein
MLFSIIPILPANTLNLPDIITEGEVNIGGYAITVTDQLPGKEFIFLYSQKKKHCFYLESFDKLIQTPKEFVSTIKNMVPFFFNYTYLKVNDRPLILLYSLEKNKQIEIEATNLLTQLVNEQGFPGMEVLFIYESCPDNFTDPDIPAYYNTAFSNFLAESDSLNKFILWGLSGKLIGQLLFIPYKNDGQIAITLNTINTTIQSILKDNNQLSDLVNSFVVMQSQNNILARESTLLKQQLENHLVFLKLIKESFNHDLAWYISEAKKIKGWSDEEIKRLKEWHYWHYEVLPNWYKKLGLRILKYSKPQNKGSENK